MTMKNTSLLANKNYTIKINAIPVLIFSLVLSGCANQPKRDHGLQKSPCACLEVIYDSKIVNS